MTMTMILSSPMRKLKLKFMPKKHHMCFKKSTTTNIPQNGNGAYELDRTHDWRETTSTCENIHINSIYTYMSLRFIYSKPLMFLFSLFFSLCAKGMPTRLYDRSVLFNLSIPIIDGYLILLGQFDSKDTNPSNKNTSDSFFELPFQAIVFGNVVEACYGNVRNIFGHFLLISSYYFCMIEWPCCIYIY
jgi:hypothetical protein